MPAEAPHNLQKRISILDSLRGVAALTVLWHHLFVLFQGDFLVLREVSPLAYEASREISDQNTNAVLFFFVLSGFAIRLSLPASWSLTGEELKRYALRRAFRILPLYWFALGWTALLGWLAFGFTDDSFTVANLAGNLLFLQTPAAVSGSWFVPYGLNGPLWSLSYEAFYYALLPAAAFVVCGMASQERARAVLVFGSLAVSVLAIGVSKFWPTPFSHFLGHWHIWVLGFVLAETWRCRSVIPYGPVSFVVLAAVEFMASSAGYASDTLRDVRNGSAIAAIAYLVVLVSTSSYSRFLAVISSVVERLFDRIGSGSYALYLLHYPVLLATSTIMAERLPGTGLTRLGLAGTIAAVFAIFICPWLEKALARLRPKVLRSAQQVTLP